MCLKRPVCVWWQCVCMSRPVCVWWQRDRSGGGAGGMEILGTLIKPQALQSMHIHINLATIHQTAGVGTSQQKA